MRLKVFFIAAIIIATIYCLRAQNNEQGIYFNANREVYIQANRPIYFYISTDTTQAPQRVNVNEKRAPSKKYMQIGNHGTHRVRHWNEETNSQEEIIINVDGISPKTKLNVINANKHVLNGKSFYNKKISLTLSATDEMSKTKATYYSINDSPFQEYSQTLKVEKSGYSKIEYYSIDNVGNKEKTQSTTFEIDTDAPKTELVLEGLRIDTVITSKTILKLNSKDDCAGVNKIYYQIDGGKWQSYNNKNVPVSLLEDDEHTLNYYAVDKLDNEEEIKEFRFYLDNKAPLVSLIALGDRFISNGKTYFSGRTKLVLIALDNKIGVDSIMYAMDKKEYIQYTEAFYLPPEQGLHSIKYYAVDKLGNKGAGGENYSVYSQESDIFVVDLLGPDMSYKLIGSHIKYNNKIFVNSKTKISISAKDKDSGLKKIKYSVGNDTTELDYNRNTPISQMANSSNISLNFSAYDNVNNRNVLQTSFVMDNKGPEIFHYFSVKPKQIAGSMQTVPSYSRLFLSATDPFVGVQNIKYSINGSKYVKYTKPITRFSKNKTYSIKVVATDKLNNENTYEIIFSTK